MWPRIVRCAGLAALEAGSAGLGLWAACIPRQRPEYVLRNVIDEALRRGELASIAVPVLVVLLVIAVTLLRTRARALATVERVAHRLAPLSLVGLVPFLFDERLWIDRQLVFLVIVVAVGFAARAAFRAAMRVEPLFPGLAARLARARWPFARVDPWLALVVAGAASYALYFSWITLQNHDNFGTASFDLGLEDNLLWNLIHGAPLFHSSPYSGPTGTHFGHHATFFAFVLAPVYALAPRAETLLVIQSVMLGGAAVPLFLYARLHLRPWIAATVAGAYLAYPPLHGANVYDFHYQPLALPLLWLVLWAVETRRRALAIVAALLVFSVREDMAGVLGVLGAFLLVSGRAARAGAALAVAGIGYFVIMKFGVMPRFMDNQESFVDFYAGLVPPGHHGFGAVLETVVGNPPYAADVILDRGKLVYVLQLFAPLALVPLSRPIGLLLCAPGFFFTLLSTGYTPLYDIAFQYTSYWTPLLFVGVVVGLAHAARARHDGDAAGALRQRAVVCALACASAACTYVDGAILQHRTVHGAFNRFHFGTTDADRARRAQLGAVLGELPPDAKVAATETIVPHLSSRRDAYTLRFGFYDAEYLVLMPPAGDDERRNARSALAGGAFGVVDDRGEFVLARRGAPSERNAALLARWKL